MMTAIHYTLSTVIGQSTKTYPKMLHLLMVKTIFYHLNGHHLHGPFQSPLTPLFLEWLLTNLKRDLCS